MSLAPIDLLGAAILAAVLAGLAADQWATCRQRDREVAAAAHPAGGCVCTDRGTPGPCPAAAHRAQLHGAPAQHDLEVLPGGYVLHLATCPCGHGGTLTGGRRGWR